MCTQTEYTQQLATLDYLVVSGKKSLLEYIENIPDSVAHPTQIKDGYFVTSFEPGYGVEYTEEAVRKYQFPDGLFWKSAEAKEILVGERM